MTRRTALTIRACWATVPVGLIWTIITGDLRPAGVALVLFFCATIWGSLVIQGERAKAARTATKVQSTRTDQ